jgi:hypothetical protein
MLQVPVQRTFHDLGAFTGTIDPHPTMSLQEREDALKARPLEESPRALFTKLQHNPVT